MKEYLLYALAFILVIAAIVFAYQGKEGWGWFLFVAVLIGGSLNVKVGDGKEVEDEDDE